MLRNPEFRLRGKDIAVIDCKELAGKVIRSLTIFEDGADGPEISIDFEDGSGILMHVLE